MRILRKASALFLFLMLCTLSGWTLSWLDPANQVDVVITLNTIFDPKVPEFHYVYDLESKPDSKEVIYGFHISSPENTGIQRAVPPQGAQWDSMLAGYSPLHEFVVDWYEDSPVADQRELFGPPPAGIQPGQKFSGFQILARNLPGIRLFWVKGWTPPPTEFELNQYLDQQWKAKNLPTQFHSVQEYDHAQHEALKDAPYFQPAHISGFSGQIVGPDVLPDNLTNAQLLDRLISLKEQAFNLGWIDNQGVANSLDAKLNEAKKKVVAEQTKVAANILRSFILDLEAQHIGQTGQGPGQGNPQGKHVNDNAFYLLKPNAEFILYKLGQL